MILKREIICILNAMYVKAHPPVYIYLFISRDLEEGDDLYFECHVEAHPPVYKVAWKFNVSS